MRPTTRSATFLVLARRAIAIRRRDAFSSWLYGVACRVATRAGPSGRRRLLDATSPGTALTRRRSPGGRVSPCLRCRSPLHERQPAVWAYASGHRIATANACAGPFREAGIGRPDARSGDRYVVRGRWSRRPPGRRRGRRAVPDPRALCLRSTAGRHAAGDPFGRRRNRPCLAPSPRSRGLHECEGHDQLPGRAATFTARTCDGTGAAGGSPASCRTHRGPHCGRSAGMDKGRQDLLVDAQSV